MALTDEKRFFELRIPRWWNIVPLFICALVFAGCVCYLSASYDYLKAWYFGLHACIYKGDQFANHFFTAGTKTSGNRFALAGTLISFGGIIYYIRLLFGQRKREVLQISYRSADLFALAIIYIFAAVSWSYTFLNAPPAYDEVFSAMNCARVHPFQTISYYPIPNNHIFFNLLNNLPAHLLSNPILSGRIISGFSLIPLLPLLYFWLRSKGITPFISALFMVVLILQFPVWGFTAQGRGYGLYLLCCWSSFIFLEYYFKYKNNSALALYAIAVVVGFWTVPSFLFWEAALIIYIVIRLIHSRSIDLQPLKYTALAGGFVWLVFLPLLCFSGIGALTENPYVVSDKQAIIKYLPQFWEPFRATIQYTFSGSVDEKKLIYLLLFFFPLAALPFLWRRREAWGIGFCVLAWLVFFGMELRMQRYPFMRNLIAHDSLMLAAVLLSINGLLGKFFKGRWRPVQYVGLIGFCGLMLVHFVRFNRDHLADSLYFYDAGLRYKTLNAAAVQIPKGSLVALSDEGFYWEYLCLRHGVAASMCAGPAADYYIKIDSEPMPDAFKDRMSLWLKADEYEIYRAR